MQGMELEEEEIAIPFIHVSFSKVIYVMHSKDRYDGCPYPRFHGLNTFKQNDSKERWRKIA